MNSLQVIHPTTHNLIEAWLNGKSPHTVRAYENDLKYFSQFLSADSIQEASEHLIQNGPGNANLQLLAYKSHMRDSGLSPATVNRRLSSVRSVIELAKSLGIINWNCAVRNERHQDYRDTTGCGIEGIRKILSTCKDKTVDIRDRAIIRLMFDHALRRGEVTKLDKTDIDTKNRLLHVQGKGKRYSDKITMSEQTANAISEWFEVHSWSIPAFVSLSNNSKGHRLTGEAIYQMIKKRGAMVGVDARPHGLRHDSITEAVKHYSVPEVMKHSRHSQMSTVQRYIDQSNNVQGLISDKLGSTL